MDYYEFVRGPLAIVSFFILFIGVCYHFIVMIMTKKEYSNARYPEERIDGTIRSLYHGLFPFAARYMKKRPVFTIITFLFHISVLLLPFFLLAHIILWFESYQIIWWNIPDNVADGLTIVIMIGCLYFLGRRIRVKEVRLVSHFSDYLLLFIIFTSCLTGLLAAHHLTPYRPTLILHILFSEFLIVLIPFSRLKHMFFFFFSRAHMGAEFGRVLKPTDW